MTPMRRLYNMLFEKPETADDLFRRLDAIEELIARGATEGEKEAARKAKDRLEQTIQAKFPNAKRPPKQSSQASQSNSGGHSNPYGNDFWGDIFKDMERYYAQQKRYAEDPDAERRDNLERIEQLKRRRKELSRWRGMGNVEVEDEYKTVAATLEGLMAKWQPEEYAELVKKRREAGDRAAEKRYKQADEKRAANKAANTSAGRILLKDIYKANTAACQKLAKALVGKKYALSGLGKIDYDGKRAQGILNILPYFGVPDIRNAFNTLSPEEQTSLKEAATKAAEKIREQSWTEPQRMKVLSAFTAQPLDKETLKKNYETGLSSGKIPASDIVKKHIELLAPLYKSRYKIEPAQKANYALKDIIGYLREIAAKDDKWAKEDLKPYAKGLKGKDTSALIADLENVLTDGPASSSKVMRPSDQQALIQWLKSLA